MNDEIEIKDFFHVWASHKGCPTSGIRLYNPETDIEYPVLRVDEAGIEVSDANDRIRKFLRRSISDWLLLVPEDHDFRNLLSETKPPEAERRALVNNLRASGLPVAHTQSLDDLRAINWAATTPMSKTDRDARFRFYSAVKKLENFPEHKTSSIRIGRRVVETWADQNDELLPADLIVHLAYYRRWSGDTDAALRASDCLNGPRFRRDLSGDQRSVLATERAAAFMDKFENFGSGLEDAEFFLRYSMAAANGKNSSENHLAWKRYNKLREVGVIDRRQ
ncbi:hypothetical protein [Ruegeria lacuscaerulensis]|uniref:hypothetical protein n=1 Tax=Ruegeria lacuscaerulensis TaxID=55218 RepID=UPI00147AABB2|nr:hypothetical protein [Ruegeria lacuscaerulensis]